MASRLRQHAVDIDELSASTKEKLQMLLPLSSERCIYSAPPGMKSSGEQYFEPRVVSIGPMHYQNEKLRENEHLKERYLAEFCELIEVSLKEYYKLILEHERKLRNCYPNVIKLNSENFVKLVLVDAAFFIMILVYSSYPGLISRTDQLFGVPILLVDLMYDLLLLENQLPFFILEDLYKLSKLQSILKIKFDQNFSEETTMTDLAHTVLKFCFKPEILKQHPPSKSVHILDLYRSYLIPANWNPERHETKTTNMPSTKKLYQAGVKIQVGCKENMFDIKFSDGKLEIPPLIIYDSTELLFRNLLAYELCHCHKTRIFSDYFEMMRQLTLSSEDTESLVQNGVIINGLSNANGYQHFSRTLVSAMSSISLSFFTLMLSKT